MLTVDLWKFQMVHLDHLVNFRFYNSNTYKQYSQDSLLAINYLYLCHALFCYSLMFFRSATTFFYLILFQKLSNCLLFFICFINCLYICFIISSSVLPLRGFALCLLLYRFVTVYVVLFCYDLHLFNFVSIALRLSFVFLINCFFHLF